MYYGNLRIPPVFCPPKRPFLNLFRRQRRKRAKYSRYFAPDFGIRAKITLNAYIYTLRFNGQRWAFDIALGAPRLEGLAAASRNAVRAGLALKRVPPPELRFTTGFRGSLRRSVRAFGVLIHNLPLSPRKFLCQPRAGARENLFRRSFWR